MPRFDRDHAFRHRITVRYGETDQMGVAYHANYLLYFEDARTAFMRAEGMAYGDVERTGVGLPVRRVDLRYRAPAFFEDELDVFVWIERSRAASITFGYEIQRARRGDGAPEDHPTLATAAIELACMDLVTRRPRVFPPELSEALGLPQDRAGR